MMFRSFCSNRSMTGLALGLALGLGAVSSVQAAQAELGRNLAATCANCHGTDGKAIGDAARLAGLPASSIVQAMTQFREGKKAATIMHQIAKGYTPEQIQLIADYFAAQK
ncbi:MAG: c-type cytochrome [Burkholderiaceae bacterium]